MIDGAGLPKVYLAGAMVFEPEPERSFAWMKQICAEQGLEGCSPIDNQIGLEGRRPGKELATLIARADKQQMQRCDAALICVDSVQRAPEMDAGTAMEVGYLHASGKKMAGWTRDTRLYPDRVRDYFVNVHQAPLMPTESGLTGGTSGLARDPDGNLVHSDGCYQNAMIQNAIEEDGGEIFAHPEPQTAFRMAAAQLAQRLRQSDA